MNEIRFKVTKWITDPRSKEKLGRGSRVAGTRLQLQPGHDFTITQFISSSSELVRTRLVAKKARLDIVIARTREQQVGPVEPRRARVQEKGGGRREGEEMKKKKKK